MTSFAAPMKTELSRFCQDYSRMLLPLRRELGNSIDFIRDQRDTDDIKTVLSSLCDAHHRMKTLAEKIDSQQAYVIIFGPLKSGKSTLMNAFSGAYVSEVTALPAYPCLVHVRHEEAISLSASRFNGQTESFDDFSQMQSAVEVYHRELAERIREVEEQEETFDPGIHCPDAIRRLDIGLPAEPLKESYTILVDTPGLYSRMKFGYDLMTREFRDSAACAVFVVKTDNLFLEQVFDEFNDLLNLFSRIFLVVNIDGHKCDLEPDGELQPSLESREPQKIVEAFCSLSMSAPLRDAYEQGRLKIYPIDLLKSASERLGSEEPPSPPSSAGGADETDEETNATDDDAAGNSFDSQPPFEDIQFEEKNEASSPHAEDSGSDPFNEFMADLTNYLNSNDYIIHFMRDSLRQGRQLIREIEQVCREDNLKDFLAGSQAIQSDHDQASEQQKALKSLRGLDWETALATVQEQMQESCDSFIQSELQRLEAELAQQVDEWFNETESLKHLLDERIHPVFERLPENFRQHTVERLQHTTDTSSAGAELPEDRRREMEKVDLSMAAIREQSLKAAYNCGDKTPLEDYGVSGEAMPVRRRFWDWLLLRRMNRIRTKLFGADYDKTIPMDVKQSRLGEKSRQAFCTNMQQKLQEVFSHLSENMLECMVRNYISTAKDAIDDELKQRIEELNLRLPRLKNRIQTREDIRQTIENLAQQVDSHDSELESLEETFSRQHPETETENAEISEPDPEAEDAFD